MTRGVARFAMPQVVAEMIASSLAAAASERPRTACDALKRVGARLRPRKSELRETREVQSIRNAPGAASLPRAARRQPASLRDREVASLLSALVRRSTKDRDDAARLAAAAEWCGISGDASRDAALEAYCAALREARSDHALDVSLRNRGVWREPTRAVFDAALAAATGSGGFRTLTAIDCSHCRSLRVDTRRLFEALAPAPIRVVDLNYAHGVAGPLPDAIGRLAKLEILTLRECTSIVGPVPDALGACERLRVLRLRGCTALTGAPPPCLARLELLEHLDLGACARLDGPLPTLARTCGKIKVVLLDGSPRVDVDLALALEEDDGLVRGLAHGVEAEDPLGGAGFEPLEPRRWRPPDLLALPALERLVLTDCVRARGPLTSAALRARDEAGELVSCRALKVLDLRGSACKFADVVAAREAKRRGIQVLLSPGDEELLSRALRDDEDAHLEPPSPLSTTESPLDTALDEKLRKKQKLEALRLRRESRDRKNRADRERREAEEAQAKFARSRAQSMAGRRPTAHEPEVFNGLTQVGARLGLRGDA